MRIRPDVEELETTRTEKVLAVVFTAFLLLGGIWTYQKLDDFVREHVPVPTYSAPGPASARLAAASSRVAQAELRRQRALENLELRREAYRTALDAGQQAPALERSYEQAQAELEAAGRALAEARREIAAARPAAQAEQARVQSRIDDALHRQARDAFFARLGLTAFYILAAYALLAWMRRRATRWFPLVFSVLSAATILAFVFAADYITDYFDPFDWGIAAIALLGILATLGAYWALQRYLVRRLPQRRVRKRQCPFCGYPAGGNERCEGCGREIVAPCTKCDAPRRVGTPYCGACGATSA
jgi:ABC-type multidrug transport system fused ATPase/permease subunit